MADEKAPKKPRVELEVEKDDHEKDGREEKAAPSSAGKRDDGSYTVGEAMRDGASHLSAWVHRTFPGHERAFWGGVVGLVAAIVFLAIGAWYSIVIAIFVIVGVAVGQFLDGDGKILDALRRLFGNQQ